MLSFSSIKTNTFRYVKERYINTGENILINSFCALHIQLLFIVNQPEITKI